MKAFEFSFQADGSCGLATAICEKKEDIVGIMESRGYENVKVRYAFETPLDKVKVKDLSVADLIKVLEFVIVKDRRKKSDD